MKKKKKIEVTPPTFKTKEKSYVLKRTLGMDILRLVIWGILLFIFAKGVIVSLRPTNDQEVQQTIKDFKQDFSEFKGENEEIIGFAQNFAKEFLTYYEQDDEGFKNRIRPYVSDRIHNMAESIISIKSGAKATYVQAYRKEKYSEGQYDVYVMAEVDYGNVVDTVILKVPVYTDKGGYIVESIPMFVTDSLLLAEYNQTPYVGTSITEAEQVSIEVSLKNFFKAYYEENADVIDYYLSKSADRTKFTGLYARYLFNKLDSLKCYREEGQTEILALVELTVEDVDNGSLIRQEYNLTIVNESGKYYIKDINTKTGNLKK